LVSLVQVTDPGELAREGARLCTCRSTLLHRGPFGRCNSSTRRVSARQRCRPQSGCWSDDEFPPSAWHCSVFGFGRRCSHDMSVIVLRERPDLGDDGLYVLKQERASFPAELTTALDEERLINGLVAQHASWIVREEDRKRSAISWGTELLEPGGTCGRGPGGPVWRSSGGNDDALARQRPFRSIVRGRHWRHSRVNVEGARPSPRAMADIDSPRDNPTRISSRSPR